MVDEFLPLVLVESLGEEGFKEGPGVRLRGEAALGEVGEEGGVLAVEDVLDGGHDWLGFGGVCLEPDLHPLGD